MKSIDQSELEYEANIRRNREAKSVDSSRVRLYELGRDMYYKKTSKR